MRGRGTVRPAMPHLELAGLALLLIQVAVILASARLVALATTRLGQPLVIAEIVAGIALGPSLLGWAWPGALALLFPASSLPTLGLLSQLGLVLFMFMIGLTLDVALLRAKAGAFVLISHTSIVVPFGLGVGAAYWLWPEYSVAGVPLGSFMLFMGAAMSITAFPVLARILSERGLMDSRVGVIALGCAAIDDVTAWCLLAFVVALVRAQGLRSGLWTAGLACAFAALMALAVRPALARAARRLEAAGGWTPAAISACLILLLASSATSELIGIHALFGAFVFGVVAPKEGPLARALVGELETVAVRLLVPIFFAYSGLRTQIGLLRAPEHWLIAIALIVLATLGKFGGSAVAARVTGLGWREASAIGVLMNTRGLMELVVLNLGMDLRVISPQVFTMLVIMALATTAATTPILKRVYPSPEPLADPSSVRLGLTR